MQDFLLRSGIALACCFATSAVRAQTAAEVEPKHMALIIGNTAYSPTVPTAASAGRLPRLPHACGDAQTVAAALVKTGWDEADINQKCDMSMGDMLAQVRAFVQQVQDNPYSIAVFYFAGHGVQIDKKSYIFGVDAKPNFATAQKIIERNSDAQLFYGSALDVYTDFINAVGSITDGGLTVILDACRSDPVIQALGGGPRKVTAPLARSRLLPGILLAVSTQDGDTAADNSAYADAIKALIRPKEQISTILTRVANKVYNDTKLTGHPQIPTMSGGLIVPCFAGCAVKPSETLEQPETHASTVPSMQIRQAGAARFIRAAYLSEATPLASAPIGQAARAQTSAIESLYSDPALSGPSQVSGSRVDVFWCEGGANAESRKTLARRYGAMLADRARSSRGDLVSVRLRPLSINANGFAGYRFLHNSVVVDSGDRIERGVGQSVIAAGFAPIEQLSSLSTPNYSSVFVCQTDARTTPGRVYWQAPGEQEKKLAQSLIANLDEITGQFHSVDGIEITPNSPSDTEIRYYFPDDRDIAFRLADSLQRALKHEVPVKLFQSLAERTSPGVAEVWMGTGELSRPAETAVEPGTIRLPSRNNILRSKSVSNSVLLQARSVYAAVK